MTRERLQNGSAAVLPPPAASALGPPRSGSDSPPHRLIWEPWFRSASPDQQNQMLALAEQQGFLFAHQVPPAQGAGSRLPEPAVSNILTQLLTGKPTELPTSIPVPLDLVDEDLDPAQREAVNRALASPDLFLLRGRPGTGKSRVLAEIIVQACRRGERVLFLSVRPAGLDVVLTRLQKRPETSPLRFLDDGETPEHLPAEIRSLAYPHRCQAFAAQALTQAASTLDQAKARMIQRQEEEQTWSALLQHHAHLKDLSQRTEQSRCQTECAQKHLEEEAAEARRSGTGADAWRQRLLDLDQARQIEQKKLQEQLDIWTAQRSHREQHQAHLLARLQQLRPLVDAKRTGRWWTLNWWKATFRGQILQQALELEEQIREVELQNHLENQEASATQQAVQEAERRWAQEETQIFAEERQRRLSQAQETLARLSTERSHLHTVVQNLLTKLGLPAASETLAVESLLAARQAWFAQGEHEETQHRFASQWADFVAASQEHLAQRFPRLATVVAVPLAALPTSKQCLNEDFDLLILEESHHLTDSDLARLTRWARRWILVSDLTEDPDPDPAPTNMRSTTMPEATGVRKLWRRLHPDASRLAYRWTREGQRWCCTLRPIPQGRAVLEIEHLADFPEIELRIASNPSPVLAQVVFPATMDLPHAKDFIYRELQEAALHTPYPTFWVQEETPGWVVHLAPLLPVDARSFRLDEGLMEWVAGTTSCRLEFAKSHWDRNRLEDWLARHVPPRDQSRTFCLERLHRHTAPLAAVLGEVHLGQRLPGARSETASASAMVFVPTPPLKSPDDRRRSGNGSAVHGAWPREGAGLELDLSANRLADRLPAEHRSGLPRTGFVNFLEAQALVRKLEQWVRSQPAKDLPSVGVLALYAGQAQLLKRLLDDNETLRFLPLEIGLPEDFIQREVDVVFLSLTRSHAHRAVNLGESPDALLLALTRARRQMFIIGDLGSLVRRVGWQGQLPPLDPAASHRETRLVARLLACMEGRAHAGSNVVLETA